jgi:hypothetical protein
LEDDLDRLIKFRDEGDTARWGPPVLDYDLDSNEELATSPAFTFSFLVCIADEVVASTTTSLKPGRRQHLLQYPAMTLTISSRISVEFDFPM